MDMTDSKWSIKTTDLLVAAAAGVGFGILNFALLFISGFLWNSVESKTIDGIRFFHDFSQLTGIHILAIALVVTLICGFVIGRYLSRNGYGQEVVLLLGGLAGFVLSLGPFSPSWILLWNSQDFLALDNFLKVFIFATAGLAVGVPLVALSAFGYWRLWNGTHPGRGKGILLTLAALGLAVLIVLPPLAAFASLEAGLLKRTPDLWLAPGLQVERTAGDTIVITNTGFHPTPGLAYLAGERPLVITLDGKDVTDAAAIVKSGLQVRIQPDEGLGLDAGRKVSFTGPAIGGIDNITVLIEGIFKDGSRQLLYSGKV
jgi:hypothetical protein